MKHLPLTVIFLDYGNVSQVDEVRDISEELAKIPSLAVRITFKISEYKPVLEEEITIRVFMQVFFFTMYVLKNWQLQYTVVTVKA